MDLKSSYCTWESVDFSEESLPWYIEASADNQLSGLVWSCSWGENEVHWLSWKELCSVCFPRTSEVRFHCSWAWASCLYEISTLCQVPPAVFVFFNIPKSTKPNSVSHHLWHKINHLSGRQVPTERHSNEGSMEEAPFHPECLLFSLHISSSMFSEKTVELLVNTLFFSFCESLICCCYVACTQIYLYKIIKCSNMRLRHLSSL